LTLLPEGSPAGWAGKSRLTRMFFGHEAFRDFRGPTEKPPHIRHSRVCFESGFSPSTPLPPGTCNLPLPQAPSFRPYAAIEGYAAVLPESMPGVPRRTAAALHFASRLGHVSNYTLPRLKARAPCIRLAWNRQELAPVSTRITARFILDSRFRGNDGYGKATTTPVIPAL
jgi:hypothetical protein